MRSWKKRIPVMLAVVAAAVALLLAVTGCENNSKLKGDKDAGSLQAVEAAEKSENPAEENKNGGEESPSGVNSEAESSGQTEGAGGTNTDPAADPNAAAQGQDGSGGADAAPGQDGSGGVAAAQGQDGSAAAAAQGQDNTVKEDTASQKAAPASSEEAAPKTAQEQETKITGQPSAAIVKEGSMAVFNVTATGKDLKYSWQTTAPSEENWKTASGSGSDTATLKIPGVTTADNNYRYRCMITDAYGKTAYSKTTVLYVTGFKTHPENQFIKEGRTATFTTAATGKDLTYRWEYRKADEEDWHKSSAEGCDTRILKVKEVPNRHNGYRYRCRIKDASGNKVYSKTAVMYVLGIRKNPETLYRKVGTKAVFSVSASGRGLKYKWQMLRPTEDEWITSHGQDVYTKSLNIPEVGAGRDGYRYRCEITDEKGNVIHSKAATMYVLKIKKDPVIKHVKAGQTATYQINASGGGLKYQWQVKKSANAEWRDTYDFSGYNSSTLKVSAKTGYNGYVFRCFVTDGGGNRVCSKGASLYVLGITKQPSMQRVKAGNAATFRISATGARVKYQWQVKDKSGAWRNSSAHGNRTNVLRVSGKTDYNGYQFRCRVTDRKGNTIYSKAASMYVLGIRRQPSDQIKVEGQTAVFSVSACGTGLKYQWQCKEYSHGSWRKSGGANTKTKAMKITARQNNDGYMFRCRITDSKGNVVYTRAAYLWVNPR